MGNPRKATCSQDQDPFKIHPALKAYFGYAMKKGFLLYKHMQESALSKYKLHPPHMGILRILTLTPSLNQITLGDELGIDKATMVKLIDHIEKLGLVHRVVDPNDRRGKLIEISRKGEKVFLNCSKVMKDVTDEFLSPLSKSEREILHSLMLKLISRESLR